VKFTGELRGNDDNRIKLGDSQDLHLYHHSSHNSFLTNSTGFLALRSTESIKLQSNTGEDMIKAVVDGAVELYHNNSVKFETTANGVYITGAAVFPDGSSNGIQVGNSSDLQIYHDGTDSFIKQATGTRLKIQGVGSNGADVHIQARSDEEGIKLLNNSGESKVELYYNNTKKFETQSSGVTFFGDLFGGDNIVLRLGNATAGDLQIYHNGTNSFIQDTAGATFNITATESIAIKTNDTEFAIACNKNGGVELYHNDSKKFETTSAGGKLTGTLDVTGAIYTFNEFNMAGQGNKFIDTAHLNHTLHFRRINDGDNGHANQCTVSSDGVWSADFNDTSDEKLKENITTISDGAINIVKQLRPVNFDWKETDKANNVSGFIAQEIKTVLPNLVYGTEYDPTIIDEKTQCIKSTGYSVNTIGIVAHLTKALQEAISKIEVLETEVASLKAS